MVRAATLIAQFEKRLERGEQLDFDEVAQLVYLRDTGHRMRRVARQYDIQFGKDRFTQPPEFRDVLNAFVRMHPIPELAQLCVAYVRVLPTSGGK